MKTDYAPYIELIELSNKYSDQLNIGDDDPQKVKNIIFAINRDFNNLFWHRYKHLYMDMVPAVKDEVENIFNILDFGNGKNIKELKSTFDKTKNTIVSRISFPSYIKSSLNLGLNIHDDDQNASKKSLITETVSTK